MEDTNLLTFDTLEEAAAAAAICTRCGLCEGRTQSVFSDGNPEAKLMIIGEGPGEQEDRQGIPFVGRAGQLLSKILEAGAIDRQNETYICNVVKCRPPGNRVPTPAEKKACRPYLDTQIRLVNPKIIVLAGSTALQSLMPIKEPISKIRGQWLDYPTGAKVIPIFHPSYLLRNESKEPGSPKWLMWQDIKKIRQALTEIQKTT